MIHHNKYTNVICCINSTGNDLDVFLNQIPSFFDGVILLDLCSTSAIIKHNKIIYYQKITPDCNTRLLFISIAYQINAKWICFMNSCESFSVTYRNFEEIRQTQGLKSIMVHTVYSRCNKYYLKSNNEFCGITKEVRMINLEHCNHEEIIDDKSDIWNGGYTAKVLLIHDISKDFIPKDNLFSEVLNIREIYRINNNFENVALISDKELESRVKYNLDRITEYFINSYKLKNNISLYVGDSGIILFLAILYKHTNDKRYAIKMNHILDKLQLLLSKSDRINPSFCRGLAGYGWLMCYLKANDLVSMDDQYFEPIDSLLKNWMILLCKEGKFDQMHEAIGIGRYFIKRGNVDCVEYIINNLNAVKITTDNEIKWSCIHSNNNKFEDKYDFGLAHGMAGYLYFLGKCYSKGIKANLCLELIQGIEKFYQNNIQDFNECGSFYPFAVPVNDYYPHDRAMHTRMGWCYGDLGVLYTRFIVARFIGNTEMELDALTKLEIISTKRGRQETQAFDAGFCHGTACLVHIFNKLYYMTGRILFKETAMYWIKFTLLQDKSKNTHLGFLYLTMGGQYVIDDSLLEGVTGTAFALLSAIDYSHIDWDEAMMLS